MSRTSGSFRRLAWLALVASLLMSVMPSVSRVLMAAAPNTAQLLMEMCTTAGRQLVDVSPFIAPEAQPGQPMAGMTDVCAYCVLATPLPLVLLLFCLLVLFPARSPIVRYYLALLRSPRNARGLGSQAPPLAL